VLLDELDCHVRALALKVVKCAPSGQVRS
jgi:hypothetical protein